MRAVMMAVVSGGLVFAILFTIFTYYWLGNALTAAKILPVLSLFSILQSALFLLPMTIR
jgi:hypothetical protein